MQYSIHVVTAVECSCSKKSFTVFSNSNSSRNMQHSLTLVIARHLLMPCKLPGCECMCRAASGASDLVPNAVLSLDSCEDEPPANAVIIVGASAQQVDKPPFILVSIIVNSVIVNTTIIETTGVWSCSVLLQQ